jgi:hypothetical protein
MNHYLITEIHKAFGYDCDMAWSVDNGLNLTATVTMYRHGGYDAGQCVGTVAATAKTARGCLQRLLRKHDKEPWIRAALYGARF